MFHNLPLPELKYGDQDNPYGIDAADSNWYLAIDKFTCIYDTILLRLKNYMPNSFRTKWNPLS